MLIFSKTLKVFSRNGTNVERINFRDGIIGNVKNTLEFVDIFGMKDHFDMWIQVGSIECLMGFVFHVPLS
jgi:hypothetical protein